MEKVIINKKTAMPNKQVVVIERAFFIDTKLKKFAIILTQYQMLVNKLLKGSVKTLAFLTRTSIIMIRRFSDNTSIKQPRKT